MKTRQTALRLAVIVAAAGLAVRAADMPAAGGAARGRLLYMSTGCYECHGTVGQGGRATGPALLPALLPLQAFISQLRDPADRMPPYTAKVMSVRDIAAIRAYLASLPPPPDPADIALLQVKAKR